MSRSSRPLIVVPTYNEVDNIDTLLQGIRSSVPEAQLLFGDCGTCYAYWSDEAAISAVVMQSY